MNQLTGFLGEEFKGSYYRTMYDLQTVNGFSSNFSTINAALVEKTLAYPWSGANYSDRLWKNKNALIDTIRETLTQGMIRGDNIRDMSKAIAEKLGSSLKNAERVVRTETSHIHNTAEIEAYKAGGYEQYEFMASFGERTCEVCGGLDGQHFKLTDIQYGVNFPPVHPNCRCTTVCWDEADEEQKALEGQKALDYEEWYRKYVEGREQESLDNAEADKMMLNTKPGKADNVETNFSIVNSIEYESKFVDHYSNAKVAESVTNCCRTILKNRDGTKYEELFAVDSRNGKILSYAKGKKENGVDMTEKLEKLLTKSQNGSIIIIHNHPNSATFSKADISSALTYPSIAETVAAGHDGTVYFAGNVYGHENAVRDYTVAYTKYLRTMPDFEARHVAWQAVAENLGFDYERR